MSCTQFAFLKKSQVPSRELLQASIDALGFDLKLDPELKLLEDSGFSPCILIGVADVGFKLFTEPAINVAGDDETLQEIAGDRDLCISMVWHSSMKDCAAAMIVSCALAKDYRAVISYEGEPPQALDELLQATYGIIEASKRERKRR